MALPGGRRISIHCLAPDELALQGQYRGATQPRQLSPHRCLLPKAALPVQNLQRSDWLLCAQLATRLPRQRRLKPTLKRGSDESVGRPPAERATAATERAICAVDARPTCHLMGFRWRCQALNQGPSASKAHAVVELQCSPQLLAHGLRRPDLKCATLLGRSPGISSPAE